MASRVVITGARGFVGGHLMAELGDVAVPADADVTDLDDVVRVLRTVRPTAVVHLAALSSVGDSLAKTGADVWRTNTLGTVNVLDAARAACPSARVLVVSTGEVYGQTARRLAREDDRVAPISPYAASKAAAEIAATRAARADRLDVVVARAFPHTGPGQDERFAIGSWAAQIARLEAAGGGAIRVGDLTVERDFTDVRDVCRAYRLLLDTSVAPGTYNVASGAAVPLKRIVETLVGLADVPVTVERDPERIRRADVRVLAGDPSRLVEATAWRGRIPLEQTLADTLAAARRAVAPSEVAAE